jgi:hypothetical protein
MVHLSTATCPQEKRESTDVSIKLEQAEPTAANASTDLLVLKIELAAKEV